MRARWGGGAVLAAVLLAAPPGRADEPPEAVAPAAEPAPEVAPRTDAPDAPSPTTPPPPEAPPPPEFMARKRPMDAEDLVRKKEGGYFTGLPLVNSDPDTGIGFGARVLYFWNGPRESPFFAYTPYRHRVFAQGFGTTNGWQYHWLDYDGLYLQGSPFRLRASLVYERNTAANYFGVGEGTLAALRSPTTSAAFDRFSDYTDDLRRLQPDGTAATRRDKYLLQRPAAAITLERDFAGGLVRVQGGLGLQHVTVEDGVGRSVRARDAAGRDVDGRQGDTRLATDCRAGVILGCGGGLHNTLKLGIAFDTRDFEPDPNAGFFVDLTGELSSRYVGSDYDYGRLTFSPRVYVSPFPQLTDLVVAARLVYSAQTDGVPFFAMNTLAMTDGNRAGLGGLRTLRGYKQDRFVGRFAAMAGVEVRWTFTHFRLGAQRFGLMLVPLLDMGRVFDGFDRFTFAGWKRGQGAGFRVAWNQATIIVVDYARSDEDSGLYINFNHAF